jgi:O-antigen/teichoic acid export membrane protein
MGEIKKQSIASSMFQVIGLVFSSVQLLIIYPALLRPDQLGIIRLFIDLSFIAAPVFLVGSSATFVKFYFQLSKSIEEVNKLKVFALLWNLLGFVFFSSLLFIFLPIVEGWMIGRSPEIVPLLIYVPILGMIVSIFQLFRAFEQAHYKIQRANFLEQVLTRVLLILLAFIISYFSYDYTQVVIGVVVAHSAMTVVLIFMHLRDFPEERFEISNWDFRRTINKELVFYSLFIFLIAVTSGIVIKLDTWMLSSMIGLEAVGIYAIALQLGVLIEFPKRAINQSVIPTLAKEWATNNMVEIESIYKKSSLVQLILGGLIFCLIFVNIDSFYKIIPNGDLYSSGKWVMFFIGLGKWFDVAAGANIEILQLSPYFKHSFWIRLSLLVLAVVFNLIFIPIYGIAGAAIATALTLLVNNLILSVLVYAILKIQPFSIQTIKALVIILICLGLSLSLPELNSPYFDVLMRSSLYAILAVSSLYYLKVSDDLVSIITRIVKPRGNN